MNIIIILLTSLLSFTYYKLSSEIKKVRKEKDGLIALREAALDISNQVIHETNTLNLHQYILETCMRLLPETKFGTILMFNSENLLEAKASVGFNKDEIDAFRLPLEESFLYIASHGCIKKTMIINRLNDIILDKNKIGSGDDEFPIRSELASPLFVHNELVGMLCIDGDKEDIFSKKDIHIMDYMSKQISQVIQRQELYDEVLQLSKFDSLTKLFNRNTYDTRVTKRLEVLDHTTSKGYLGIIDLDGLKSVNDHYGHAVGDLMIQKFAHGLQNHIEPFGICARYGGDEFVVFTDEISEIELVEVMKNLEHHLLENPIVIAEHSVTTYFSYGLASTDDANYSLKHLYNLADQRMYSRKRQKQHPHLNFRTL
jgi:diguanylate cyclase (GGDEF)-like protein